jgi:hypothetical protein
MLKFIEFQIEFTKEALIQMYQMRDTVQQRGMQPWGSLKCIGAPMATGITLWDEELQHRIEASCAVQWPEKI